MYWRVLTGYMQILLFYIRDLSIKGYPSERLSGVGWRVFYRYNIFTRNSTYFGTGKDLANEKDCMEVCYYGFTLSSTPIPFISLFIPRQNLGKLLSFLHELKLVTLRPHHLRVLGLWTCTTMLNLYSKEGSKINFIFTNF